MKILVFGGNGMIGHQVADVLAQNHEVLRSYRGSASEYSTENTGAFNVDIRNLEKVKALLSDFKPDAIVNCVGIVKQKSQDILPALELNAVWPHQLQKIMGSAKLIQISTDCVFSGKKGGYTELDVPDADDNYGRTKLLGEISNQANTLTLRTSTIGLEQNSQKGLVEWFLSQKGKIKGFRRAIYSGLITTELGRVIDLILTKHFDLSGLFHVGAIQSISKYELLREMSQRLERQDIELIEDNNFTCDRSFHSQRFFEITGYKSPSWKVMLDELCVQIRGRK